MCLELARNSKKLTAKEDIVVYKFVDIHPSGGYITSYMAMPIEIGNTYTSNLIRNRHTPRILEIGLHSLIEQGSADCFARHFREVLIECIIPKGSKYYIGEFDGHVGLASDTITYVRVLEDYTTWRN